MDSLKPFLDWRQTKEIHHHKNESIINVTSSTDKILADLAKRISLLERGQVMLAEAFEKSPLAARVRHLEERLAAGASMADLQLIAKAVDRMGQDLKSHNDRIAKAEDNTAFILKHAMADARLTEDALQ